MSSLIDLGKNLLAIGERLLPLVVPGATPIIEAAQSVVAGIDNFKQIEGAQTLPELDAIRDQLEAKVFAHADKTAASLI